MFTLLVIGAFLLTGAFGMAILVVNSQYIMHHYSTRWLFYICGNADSSPVRKLPVAEGLRFGQLTLYDGVNGKCYVLQATGGGVNLISDRYVLLIAGPTDRAVWGVGLRPLACWDCGFESHRGHGCLSVVSVLSGRGLCDELITRLESYRLWCVVVCDLEKPQELESHNPRWVAAPQ